MKGQRKRVPRATDARIFKRAGIYKTQRCVRIPVFVEVQRGGVRLAPFIVYVP